MGAITAPENVMCPPSAASAGTVQSSVNKQTNIVMHTFQHMADPPLAAVLSIVLVH